MDITYYFGDAISSINKGNQECINFVNKLIKTKDINLIEYSYMLDFFKTGGSLKNASWMCELLLRINNLKFSKKCETLYPYIKDPNIILGQLIENEKIFQFTKDQIIGFQYIINTIFNHTFNSIGLYGYAGSGKTTVVIHLVHHLLVNKLIKSVAFTAPTNKAVNIMKAKFRSCVGEKSHLLDEYFSNFITIHKLLNYSTDFDTSGNRIFVKKNKNSILEYDLIIVDECSMLPLQLVTHIYEELRKLTQTANDNVYNIPKIIFSGDPAQLPPVNETCSALFSFLDGPKLLSISFDNFLQSLPNNNYQMESINGDALRKRYDLLVNDIKKMNYVIMKEIVRNVKTNVNDMCYNIRQWVVNEVSHPTLKKFPGDGVYLYKYDGKSKLKSIWYQKFIDSLNSPSPSNLSNIIITWTNKQTDEYNNFTRKFLFKNPGTFEIGDILMLNDFYNYSESKDTNRAVFYTSEQIKVLGIEKIQKKCILIDESLNNNITKLSKMKNYNNIIQKCRDCITQINNKTKKDYLVWKLQVKKMFDVDDTSFEQIFVIHETSKPFLDLDKNVSSHMINVLRTYYQSNYKEKLSQIDKHIIKPLWRMWNDTFITQFADVNYGYSITTHKSQGSTFYNIFVDAHDILQNQNINEAKRCIYTSHTRSSNEIHILI